MILWCAYCQRYKGEKAPFEDYRLSHGLCPSCDSLDASLEAGLEKKMAPVREFYDGLRAFAQASSLSDASVQLSEAARLGIHPMDLALGMLQPALYEIGDLWAHAKLDVAHEHVSTQRVRDLLDLMYSRFPECAQCRNAEEPTVLLCAPTSNQHTLGLKFVELALSVRGVPTQRLPASVGDIVARVVASRPRWVGVSIALPSQLVDAEEIAAAIASAHLSDPPRVVVGGGPLRHGVADRAESRVEVVASVDDLAGMISK